jgi:hypothetical protein
LLWLSHPLAVCCNLVTLDVVTREPDGDGDDNDDNDDTQDINCEVGLATLKGARACVRFGAGC